MNRIVVGCVIGVGLMASTSSIVADTALESDEQKYSYALGYQIGSQIQRQLVAAVSYTHLTLPTILLV